MNNVDKVLSRCNHKCEMCGKSLEKIFNIKSKNYNVAETDPAYGLIGVCKECGEKLCKGQTIPTTTSIKLIIYTNERDGSHQVKFVNGNLSDREIKNKLKGDYSIQGPFYITDVISNSKLLYYLGKNK